MKTHSIGRLIDNLFVVPKGILKEVVKGLWNNSSRTNLKTTVFLITLEETILNVHF